MNEGGDGKRSGEHERKIKRGENKRKWKKRKKVMEEREEERKQQDDGDKGEEGR